MRKHYYQLPQSQSHRMTWTLNWLGEAVGLAVLTGQPDALHLSHKRSNSGHLKYILAHITQRLGDMDVLNTYLKYVGVFPQIAEPRAIWPTQHAEDTRIAEAL